MKRLVASIVGGILIPVIYTLVIIVICEFVIGHEWGTIIVNEEEQPSLLYLPTMAPVYISALLHTYNVFGLRDLYYDDWFMFPFLILFDFSLYAILTYKALRKLGWLAQRTKATTPLGLAGGEG